MLLANANELEKIARQRTGPLAQAIAGAGGTAANALFIGHSNVVPQRAARLLRLISWANCRGHVFARLLRDLGRWQKVYGNLITTMLFAHKQPQDRVTIVAEGELLRSVWLERESGEHVEFALLQQEPPVLTQTLYFGKTLPDGSDRLALFYRYDRATGALHSSGPQQVSREQWQKISRLELPTHTVSADMLATFSRLTRQSTEDSLTFAANSGVLAALLRALQQPELGVDFSRVVVHSLAFVRPAVQRVAVGDALATWVEPLPLEQSDKGEVVRAAIVSAKGGQQLSRCVVSLLVRGNLPNKPDIYLARIVPVAWRKMRNYEQELLKVMGKEELFVFAALNGDWNPLHQSDGVAQMAGFNGRINPGFGLIAEIEALLRRRFPGRHLAQLTATFIRPAYPGQEYLLAWAQSDELFYRYQLRRRGDKEKILVDGNFGLM